MFYDFYDNASSGLHMNTEYILNFLLVAAGYDTKYKHNRVPISQLAMSMEEVALDSIIMQWASSQFGGIKHIAALQEAAENLATSHEDLSLHCDKDERKLDTNNPD